MYTHYAWKKEGRKGGRKGEKEGALGECTRSKQAASEVTNSWRDILLEMHGGLPLLRTKMGTERGASMKRPPVSVAEKLGD